MGVVLHALSTALGLVAESFVPAYTLIVVVIIFLHFKTTRNYKADEEVKYALPKRLSKDETDWKKLISGKWAMNEAHTLEEWCKFIKAPLMRRVVFLKMFFHIKHNNNFDGDFFTFARYMKSPDEPIMKVSMKLYHSEEEALMHMRDVQLVDPGDKILKCFSSYINEKEKSLITLISPVDTSGSFLHLTHVRRMLGHDQMSLEWKGVWFKDGMMTNETSELDTVMCRISS